MEKYSRSGNLEWENEKTGDKVLPRPDDHLIIIDFKKLCTHADGAYCCFCISRLKLAVETAERLLHSSITHDAVEEEGQVGKFPEQVAITNYAQGKAFCMKLNFIRKIRVHREILGRADGETGASQKLLIALDYRTHCRVHEAEYIRGFRVHLGKDTPEESAKRFWGCPSSFLVDADYLVEKKPFKDLLGKNEVLLDRKKEANLFGASAVRNPDEEGGGEVHSGDWIGYMIPRGSHVQFIMEDVPILESSMNIEIEFDLVTYTTRGFKKSGSA